MSFVVTGFQTNTVLFKPCTTVSNPPRAGTSTSTTYYPTIFIIAIFAT